MPISSNKTDPRTGGIYSDLENFEGWTGGLNNIQRPNSVPPKTQLTDALNVDFDDLGKPRTRQKLESVKDGNFDGGMAEFQGKLYCTKDSSLIRYTDDTFTTSEFLFNITQPQRKMYFLSIGEKLYFSNGVDYGVFNQNETMDIWGIDSPILPPVAFATSGGLLPKGVYLIAHSYTYGSYETGVSPITSVNITEDNSKIVFSVPQGENAISANIYAQIGETLFLMKKGFSGEITDIVHDQGKLVKSEQSRKFPPLINLAWYKGRVFGTDGNKFYFTNEFDFRQYDPKYNSATVDNTEIKCLMALDDSLIIATQRAIYKYSGQPLKFNVEVLFEVSMIEGTEFKHERKPIQGFLTNAGVFTISSDGNVSNISENSVEFSDNYSDGSAVFRMQDGIISVLFSLKQVGEKSEYENESYIKIN